MSKKTKRQTSAQASGRQSTCICERGAQKKPEEGRASPAVVVGVGFLLGMAGQKDKDKVLVREQRKEIKRGSESRGD
jgi:hypothetical protein